MAPLKFPNMLVGGGTSRRQLGEHVQSLERENEELESRISDLQSRLHLLQQTTKKQKREVYKQRQKIKDQQGHNELMRGVAAAAEEEKRILQTRVRELSDQLKAGKATVHSLRSENATLEAEVQTLKHNALVSGARLQDLDNANNDNMQQLSIKSATINRLNDSNSQLQKRVAYLEETLSLAQRETENHGNDYLHDRTSIKKAHGDMAPKPDVKAMETRNATLQQSLDELQEEALAFQALQPLTLRNLLALRLVEASFAQTSTDMSGEALEGLQAWWPKGLSVGQLDMICSTARFRDMVNLLPRGPRYSCFYGLLDLACCGVCSRQKFRFKRGAHVNDAPLMWLQEFTTRSAYFSCCCEKICKDCFLQHTIDSLKYKWWYKLGSLRWLACPRSGCGNALGIRCEGDLQICLERNGDTEVEKHVQMYAKALSFRQALEALDPRPSDEALGKAAELYQHLVRTNRIYSYFDPRFDPALVDESGCIPEFNPGVIFNAKMETGPSPVPLFLKLFRRQHVSKECVICSGRRFEIDHTDVGTWKAECEPFKGTWMWDILVFPTSEVQHCDHDFNVCRSCTAKYIRSILTSGGADACEALSCPQCQRQLTYQEVMQLADAETATRYEKFLLRNWLAKDPNFRECLSGSCTNGQLYRVTPRNPRISCEACGFRMCFNHQTPWHEGLSCSEYDSRKNQNQEAQEWIRTNTKICPSCSRPISKDGGCFHMTCRCGHEFCWECLTSWDEIRQHGRDSHKIDCYFRTSTMSPMGVRGSSLQEALRGRNL